MTTYESSPWADADGASAESDSGLPVYRLLAELARVEDALRARPDSPELNAEAAALVRQLRERSARPGRGGGPLRPDAPGHQDGPDPS
jgi:hypothetical protein